MFSLWLIAFGHSCASFVVIELLEFDVVLCADGFPVITHNHAIHAPTFRIPETDCFVTEEPKVLDLNWSELQSFEIGRLDAHSQYGERFPDQLQLDGIKVPKLADLLSYAEHLGDQKIYLMLRQLLRNFRQLLCKTTNPFKVHTPQQR